LGLVPAVPGGEGSVSKVNEPAALFRYNLILDETESRKHIIAFPSVCNASDGYDELTLATRPDVQLEPLFDEKKYNIRFDGLMRVESAVKYTAL